MKILFPNLFNIKKNAQKSKGAWNLLTNQFLHQERNPYAYTLPTTNKNSFAQSVGAVECTDCISAEGYEPTSDECPSELPVMLKYGGLRNTLSLPSFPGPHWPGMVALDRILSMGQIKLNCVLMLN